MRSLLTLAGVLSAVGPGAAAEFPGGTFGEKEGCRYAKTGESSGADEFLLLNEKGVTSSTAFCSLEKATARTGSTYSLVLSCETEGESGGAEAGTATFKKDAWSIRLEDGTVWGPIKRCK